MRAAAFLLAACSFAATAAPAEIKAEYQLINNGLVIGSVQESFSRTGDTYQITSVSHSEGILKVLYDETITYSSSGRVGPKGLQPLRFEERRVRGPRHNVQATFDWNRGLLLTLFRGENSEHALPPETQDRISMMYQFMYLTPRPGTFAMNMSNGRKVERYTYRMVDQPRITTPIGEFETFHFERVPESPKDNRVEVWVAKDRDNFPVRVVFDDPKGLRVEQSLVAFKAR